MSNPSKEKGTAAESAVVEFLRSHGWPSADRAALHGRSDIGDWTGVPGICGEIKAVGIYDLPGWLRELQLEVVNAHADLGVLVVKPRGVGHSRVGRWWAIQELEPWTELARRAGYGNTP